MDEETMDLDAIDQLAWYRIIQFLDHKSQLHCRSLSPTIKTYVDYMGLQLTIDKLSVLKSPEREAWEEFLSTRELYLWKVHITANGNDLQALGITLQHQVEVLKISCFLSLNSIVNTTWIRNIVELSFHKNALASRLFEKHDDGHDVILLPCLRKLIFSVKFGRRTDQEWWEIRRISMSNVATLMRQIRSDFMKVIFVEFMPLKGFDHEPAPNLHAQLLHELYQSIQSHSKTLQTVIFHCYSTYLNSTQMELPMYEANMEFTSIPYGLKNVDIDFLPYCIPSSTWLKMFSQLKHLEELVARPEDPEEQVPNNFMEIIEGVLQNNFRTLKYIGISLPYVIDAKTLNLGIFGCCSSLERLQLDAFNEWDEPRSFANLPMLPTSLKILNIRGFCPDVLRVTNTLAPEEIPFMCKFKNLLEFRLEGCLALSSEQLIQFIKIIARLPKLNFLQFDETVVLEEGYIENSNQLQGFFETLGECEPDKILHDPDPDPDHDPYPNPPEIEILFAGIPWYDDELYLESEEDTGYYKEFAGPASGSQIQKTWDEVNGCANLRTSLILPEVTETRFRIWEHYQ